jgi:hypothetical protein
MNPNHYPPSPSYYRHGNADARDLVSPSYWTDSALVHLMRAGRKDGEPFADAVRNAFVCLALWFRSQSLPVPFYSAELDAAHKRLHRRPVLELLEIEAPFGPVDLGPFSLNATGTGNPQWISITRPPDVSDEDDTGHIHGVRAESPLEAVAKLAPWLLEQYLDAECELAALRATVAALTAVDRPVAPALDPFAALLEVETDEQLERWLWDNSTGISFKDANTTRWAVNREILISFEPHGHDARHPWRVHAPGTFDSTATEAARTLHRILGAAP